MPADMTYQYIFVALIILIILVLLFQLNKYACCKNRNESRCYTNMEKTIMLNTNKGPVIMDDVMFNDFILNNKRILNWLKRYVGKIDNVLIAKQVEKLMINFKNHVDKFKEDANLATDEIDKERRDIMSKIGNIRYTIAETDADEIEKHPIEDLLVKMELEMDFILYLIKNSLCDGKRFDFRDLDAAMVIISKEIHQIAKTTDATPSDRLEISQLYEMMENRQRKESYRAQPDIKRHSVNDSVRTNATSIVANPNRLASVSQQCLGDSRPTIVRQTYENLNTSFAKRNHDKYITTDEKMYDVNARTHL